MWLKHAKFEIRSNFGYKVQPKSYDSEVPNLESFFEDSHSASKLVYRNDDNEVINAVAKAAKAKGFDVEINCNDLAIIRAMEGKCLIVTGEELMRGIDYRLKKTTGSMEDGIDLLIMRSFSSKRAVEQGLSRVGRYNEPCRRYKLESVPLLNDQAATELNMKIATITN